MTSSQMHSTDEITQVPPRLDIVLHVSREEYSVYHIAGLEPNQGQINLPEGSMTLGMQSQVLNSAGTPVGSYMEIRGRSRRVLLYVLKKQA